MDGKVSGSKAEFVWLMVELARRDRDLYRQVRARGWDQVIAHKILVGKSDCPN